jgi:hypothetical protein
MGGSLWVVWPFQDRVFELIRKKQRLVSSTPMLPESADAVTLGAFALMGVGIVAVLGMEAYAGRAKPSSIQ